MSTAWCKRNDKSADPPTPKSDNTPPPPRVSAPLPPRNQMPCRGGGTAARGSKHGPRAGQFRSDNFYSRGTRRTENHVSADSSINWRRSQGAKSSRLTFQTVVIFTLHFSAVNDCKLNCILILTWLPVEFQTIAGRCDP